MAKSRHWIYLIILAIVWGSSFILMKRGLFTLQGAPLFSGIQVGALRIVLAAFFMLPLVWKYLKLINRKNILPFLVVGICGNALPNLLFATAQTEIPSALAGMLNGMVPLFSLIIAFFVFKIKVKSWQVAGLFLGLFASVGLMLTSEGSISGDINIWYALLAVLATLCYAISLNTIKQYLQNESTIAITGIALLIVCPFGLGLLYSTDFIETLNTADGAWKGIGAITVLAIFGTALALLIFNKLVQETNTIFASSVTYLIPVVAIGWGMFDGEVFNLAQMAFTALMLGGIVLINRK